MGQSSHSDNKLSKSKALALAVVSDTAALAAEASLLRDEHHLNIVSYSRKVFIPLTHLCRDVCHYCTFAKTPKHIGQAFLSMEQVLDLCHEGAKMGCQEALFTLGEKPELRYKAAREALLELGYETTIDYVHAVAKRVLAETGLLPHINAGNMTAQELRKMRDVSASMGIMLESTSTRLTEKGMPHYGSPDKDPAVRLETLRLAGEEKIPFTTGILIGIGETRRERIESFLAIRDLHDEYGHIQEIIVQNFRAKPDTKMALAPEPDLEDLLWTIAVARLIFGAKMNIQAPPNLSPGVLPKLIAAGINDWGGVSPLTPDHVNPEAPWPHLDQLANETAAADKFLEQRLTIYPAYLKQAETWVSDAVRPKVLCQADGDGFAKRDNWQTGESSTTPAIEAVLLAKPVSESSISKDVIEIVKKCLAKDDLSTSEVARLFESRGPDFSYIAQQADSLRRKLCGNTVSYVVNRNINYTNVCYFKCQFCAFSKGKASENLRGKPYDISAEEIARRCDEAWNRGASEVCLQGGIHPDYTGQTYLDILATVREATPEMHIHAFSPLEVWQGAKTLEISLEEFLIKLKAAGLNTLPGTAAEILHDDIRAKICPDKLNSRQWLQVMETAHRVGFKTTATIMYGHVETSEHLAAHLLKLRCLQQRTGGFTEFVPLPYVPMEAPMFLKGKSRKGPSFREAVLMHAVSRLVFNDLIPNIQTSWVKMGHDGVQACLNSGANDLGGTLMNESITRAAGADHGQEWSPMMLEQLISKLGRTARMRNTLYGEVDNGRIEAANNAQALTELSNTAAQKLQRSKKLNILAQQI
ncbi:MAG: FO synthase [Pseudohongiellaceae bacterium]